METIENCILKTGGTKKATKELTNTKNWVVKMKDERGKISYDRTDILETATSYYKKLYGSNNIQDRTELLETSSISDILHIKVEKAIDSQKNDKAPGPDGISNEITDIARRP
ncbi:hypothetical protein EVAR_57164_1 [Eumeta japonica]|uniref:Uncharacterized protein n=1 Tax=Eumeta variegata TaxID=151549 RepID=A0A4C1YQR1_EUMVA|nr:hypothetical protein EVAR_57164_1 [Eumeta japonica]